MKLGQKCTICGERIDPGEITTCGQCGQGVHAPCKEYEQNYECKECGEEIWIGAADF